MTSVDFKCECCKGIFHIPNTTREDVEGATADCPLCDALVILEKGEAKNFHKWLNAKEPEWPADGKNTGVIDV
jgi:hypothetical protein